MTFQESKDLEMRIATHLARKRNALIWPGDRGRVLSHDFTMFVPLKVEFKMDFKAEKSGNFFFEVHNCKQDKPSGLSATEAPVIYHLVPPNRLFNYDPKYVLSGLKGGKIKARYLTGCGDENSNGYLVAIADAKASGYFEEEEFDPNSI